MIDEIETQQTVQEAQDTMSEKKTFFDRVKKFLITTILGGFAVVLPIGLMAAIGRILYRFISSLLEPLRALYVHSPNIRNWIIDLISLAIILLLFFILGLIVKTTVGSRIVNAINNRLLSQIPLYPTIRKTVQQFLGRNTMPFSQVVIVRVFGSRMTGFVTEEHPNGMFTVFVPTAPNPTNGFVIHAEKSEVELLEIRPEAAMRTIVGMGTGSSVLFEKKD